MSADSHDQLRKNFRSIVSDLGVQSTEPASSEPLARRRASRSRIRPQSTLRIIERDGILSLQEGGAASAHAALGRRGRRCFRVGGKVVDEVPFDRLPRDKISAAVEAIDAKLTPPRGLRELKARGWVANAEAVNEGRILLFVHGTFSNNDALLKGLNKTKDGKRFLTLARQRYDQILGFDHPTLSQSVLLNARELARLLESSRAHIDVISHSRGGLVARWWLEGFDKAPMNRRRAVFVGVPMEGTGLAAAPNLKGALDLMANASKALGTASAAVPFLAVATGLFQVFSSVASLMAKTPVLDAAIHLVPGLASMSRVANNPELASLRRGSPSVGNRYFAVTSNFEPNSVRWKFWEAFRDLGQRAADLGADMVFDGQNDLVVDTPSMSAVGITAAFPAAQVESFGTNGKVHHTNYFEQERTIAFLRRVLQVN